MRTAIVLALVALTGCAGFTVPTTTQDQLTGEKCSIRITRGIDLPKDVWNVLSPETLNMVAMKLAEGGGLRELDFHPEQHIGTTATSQAEQQLDFEAKVAKELNELKDKVSAIPIE